MQPYMSDEIVRELRKINNNLSEIAKQIKINNELKQEEQKKKSQEFKSVRDINS